MKNFGQQLAALRKRVKGKCKECGEEFEKYKGAKYCSPKCRQQAYRKRS